MRPNGKVTMSPSQKDFLNKISRFPREINHKTEINIKPSKLHEEFNSGLSTQPRRKIDVQKLLKESQRNKYSIKMTPRRVLRTVDRGESCTEANSEMLRDSNDSLGASELEQKKRISELADSLLNKMAETEDERKRRTNELMRRMMSQENAVPDSELDLEYWKVFQQIITLNQLEQYNFEHFKYTSYDKQRRVLSAIANLRCFDSPETNVDAFTVFKLVFGRLLPQDIDMELMNLQKTTLGKEILKLVNERDIVSLKVLYLDLVLTFVEGDVGATVAEAVKIYFRQAHEIDAQANDMDIDFSMED